MVYCDASALLRRVLDEEDSGALNAQLSTLVSRGALLSSSALARVEVSRALARRSQPIDDGPGGHDLQVDQQVDLVLGDVGLFALNDDVLDVAARLTGRQLGSLDAIHVATALLSEADLVVTRDLQMARACEELGLAVA